MTEKPMTPNQIVASNLKAARMEQGWTRQKASQELGRFGISWAGSTWAIAEAGGWERRPAKRFHADELVALCALFDKPLAWFFRPSEASDVHVGVWSISATELVPLLATGASREEEQ